MAQHVWSRRISARYTVSLLDLPCQACEVNRVLGAVKAIHGGGDEEAIRFILKRLPSGLRQLRPMGWRLKQRIPRLTPGKGDGYDRQAARAVTKAWLQMKPQWQGESLHALCTRGGGDIFRLPSVVCPLCSSTMAFDRNKPRSDCDACYRARRRKSDLERTRKKRRLIREAREGNGRM